MIRDLLILPDGREVFSGVEEAVSVSELRYTKEVNSASELDFCCACAAMIQVRLLDTTGVFSLEPGTALQHYRVDEAGNRLLMGTFYAEKPTRPSLYTVEFTAYDAMILTEKDLTAWLAALTGWPYTMGNFLQMVCSQCGLSIAKATLCNSSYRIYPFALPVTGRQLISWIAEANGSFVSINPQGELEFSVYTAGTRAITERDLKSLKLSEAPCAPIDQVLVRREAGDVGSPWPAQGTQTYTITGNPLLAFYSTSSMQTCTQAIYNQVKGITYTPFEAEVFVDTLASDWQPGQMVEVKSADKTVTCAIFSISLQGNLAKLKSVGQPNRSSAAARYDRDQVKLIQGQMTRMQIDVSGVSTEVSRVEGSLEGLQSEMEDEISQLQLQLQENASQMQVTADKISAGVSQAETTTLASLELVEQSVQSLKKQVDMAITAQQLELSIASVTENGVQKVQTRTGYTFDQEGLSISDSRSDVHNLIDHNGMYVSRGEDVILQADADGVIARDVKVHNYLVVGDHARLEDYQTNRTACFWL